MDEVKSADLLKIKSHGPKYNQLLRHSLKEYPHQVSSVLGQEFWLNHVDKIHDRLTDRQTDTTKPICLLFGGGWGEGQDSDP